MPPIWVIDSSSIIQIKNLPRNLRPQIVAHLDQMVLERRLVYPRQVLGELKRYTSPKELSEDPAYVWAKGHEAEASYPHILLEEGKVILNAHPDLIDPDKPGPDPADPYVIAVGQKLRDEGHDARIVTDDTRQINRKVSVAAVAGLLGIPSTIMRLFLRGEGFNY